MENFWRGRRILLTGGSGFLGQWVQRALAQDGATDVVAPRRSEFDLCVSEEVARLFGTVRPHVVIHLAAEVGGIVANQRHPGRFFYNNAVMGLNCIEQARLSNVERFVCVGSVCSYPKSPPVPFREESLWDGYPEETNAPYGLAKRMLLVALQAYGKEYGLRGAYLIPTNLYGIGASDDPATSHVIPALVRKFIEARDARQPAVTVWGSGRASRDFLYVADAADAVVRAAVRCDDATPINLGSGREITIRELVERIASLVGYTGTIEWDASRPDGQLRRQVDSERAGRILEWQAQTSFEEGLARTVAWYESRMTREALPPAP